MVVSTIIYKYLEPSLSLCLSIGEGNNSTHPGPISRLPGDRVPSLSLGQRDSYKPAEDERRALAEQSWELKRPHHGLFSKTMVPLASAQPWIPGVFKDFCPNPGLSAPNGYESTVEMSGKECTKDNERCFVLVRISIQSNNVFATLKLTQRHTSFILVCWISLHGCGHVPK